MGPFDHIPPPTQNAIVTSQQVHSKLQEAFPPAVGNFEKLFDAWKATWHTPEMEFEAKYELSHVSISWVQALFYRFRVPLRIKPLFRELRPPLR